MEDLGYAGLAVAAVAAWGKNVARARIISSAVNPDSGLIRLRLSDSGAFATGTITFSGIV